MRDGFIYYFRDPNDEFPARVVFLEVDSYVENATDLELIEEASEYLLLLLLVLIVFLILLLSIILFDCFFNFDYCSGRPRANSSSKPAPRQRGNTNAFATNLKQSPSTTLYLSPSSNLTLNPTPSSQFISAASSNRASLSAAAATSLTSSLSSSLTSSSLTSSLTSSNTWDEETQLALTVPVISDSSDLLSIAMHAEGTAHINASNTNLHTNAARSAASLAQPNASLAFSSARDALYEASATASAASLASQAFLSASRAAESNIEMKGCSAASALEYAQKASEIAQAYASAAQAAASAASSAAIALAAAAQAELAIASIPTPPPLPDKPLFSPPKVRRFVSHKKDPKEKHIPSVLRDSYDDMTVIANAPKPPPLPVSPRVAAKVVAKKEGLKKPADPKPATTKPRSNSHSKKNDFVPSIAIIIFGFISIDFIMQPRQTRSKSEMDPTR